MNKVATVLQGLPNPCYAVYVQTAHIIPGSGENPQSVVVRGRPIVKTNATKLAVSTGYLSLFLPGKGNDH